MVDAVTVDQRVLTVSDKDQLLDPEKEEEWNTAKDPKQRHDSSKQQSEEYYIQHKSIYKLHLKSLTFDIISHFNDCLLFSCKVTHKALSTDWIDDINDGRKVEWEDGHQHYFIGIVKEPSSVEICLRSVWYAREYAVNIASYRAENIINWNTWINTWIDLNINEELKNSNDGKVEGKSYDDLWLYFPDFSWVASHRHQMFHDFHKKELQKWDCQR